LPVSSTPSPQFVYVGVFGWGVGFFWTWPRGAGVHQSFLLAKRVAPTNFPPVLLSFPGRKVLSFFFVFFSLDILVLRLPPYQTAPTGLEFPLGGVPLAKGFAFWFHFFFVSKNPPFQAKRVWYIIFRPIRKLELSTRTGFESCSSHSARLDLFLSLFWETTVTSHTPPYPLLF